MSQNIIAKIFVLSLTHQNMSCNDLLWFLYKADCILRPATARLCWEIGTFKICHLAFACGLFGGVQAVNVSVAKNLRK